MFKRSIHVFFLLEALLIALGRFKNQVEQFLGALSFANDTGRTLVLPYWVEYPEVPTSKEATSVKLTYFDINF